MTSNGYAQIEEELTQLKKMERPKVIADIAEARAHGDLSENAEYSAAKERQSFIEGRIVQLSDMLARAEVILPGHAPPEKVVFGATVYLRDIGTGAEKKYTLVGMEEADLKKGTISIQSPVGRALVGHKVGDFVEIVVPAKTIEYELLNIAFE